MSVFLPIHGHQPPPSNAPIYALITGPFSVATSPTQTTHDTMSAVGKDKLSDVLPAQTVYYTTNNGTPVCTTVSTRPNLVVPPQPQLKHRIIKAPHSISILLKANCISVEIKQLGIIFFNSILFV